MSRNVINRRRKRGVTYIEVMVASLILVTCIAAMVSMWYFALNMSTNTEQKGIAYSVGRQEIEKLKLTNFYNTPLSPASWTDYFDSQGHNQGASRLTSSLFQATMTVSCDQTTTNTSGQTIVADTGLMTVSVTVTLVPSGRIVYASSTNMVRAGI